jgi:hypothetical protein
LVIASGGTPSKYTAFPIAPDEITFRTSLLPSYLGGASADIRKLVSRLKPYGGRNNDALWRLHSLDIADKHKLLIPVAAAHTMLGIQYHVTDEATRDMPKSPMLRTTPPERKFPLKDGDILLVYPRVRLPFIDESKFDFAFEIAFGEGQIFDGEPVIPTLTKLVDLTERLIDIFARRILKISW